MFKKYRIYIVIAIVLIVSVYLYTRYKRKKAEEAALTNTPANNTAPEATKPAPSDKFPLIKGSKGQNVAYLQNALNKLGGIYPALKVDGVFGQNTYNKLVLLNTKYYPVTSEIFTEIINRSINQ